MQSRAAHRHGNYRPRLMKTKKAAPFRCSLNFSRLINWHIVPKVKKRLFQWCWVVGWWWCGNVQIAKECSVAHRIERVHISPPHCLVTSAIIATLIIAIYYRTHFFYALNGRFVVISAHFPKNFIIFATALLTKFGACCLVVFFSGKCTGGTLNLFLLLPPPFLRRCPRRSRSAV